MSLTIIRPSIPVPLPLSRGGLEATTAAGGRATLELGDLAQLTAPGGTSTFLRADKTWAVPAGGGGGAPTDAEYITSTTNATLSAERVLTDTATITWDRATAGQIKANAIGGGGYTDEQAQDAVGRHAARYRDHRSHLHGCHALAQCECRSTRALRKPSSASVT